MLLTSNLTLLLLNDCFVCCCPLYLAKYPVIPLRLQFFLFGPMLSLYFFFFFRSWSYVVSSNQECTHVSKHFCSVRIRQLGKLLSFEVQFRGTWACEFVTGFRNVVPLPFFFFFIFLFGKCIFYFYKRKYKYH